MAAGTGQSTAGVVGDFVDVRAKGKWIKTPALNVGGDLLIASGTWPRIARVRGEQVREEAIQDPETYLAALRSDAGRALKADVFSFAQRVPSVDAKFSFPMEMESVAAIALVNFDDWWTRLPQESRKNVRRSQKRGVVIVARDLDGEVVDGIRSVNDDTTVRQGAKNAYFGLSREDTWKRYGEFEGRCHFLCAYAGDEMIGFLHLVYCGKVASILNLTVKHSQFDKRPANALVAKAVEMCDARGVSHIEYGLYNYGNKRDSSLREFKIRNGFTEILVPRYFVPLTLWGTLCIRAGLHRGLIGNLPPSVISVGLKVRASLMKVVRQPV